MSAFNISKILPTWTYNEEKRKCSAQTIVHMEYHIPEVIIKLDPERLQELMKPSASQNPNSLERTIQIFAYYESWIKKFSDKNKIYISTQTFPQSGEALLLFQILKTNLGNAMLTEISDNVIFVVEIDASHKSVSAVQRQDNQPVAFHARSMKGSELNYASVEKEALAIVDTVEKYRYLLIGRHFILITDQKFVEFMFHHRSMGK